MAISLEQLADDDERLRREIEENVRQFRKERRRELREISAVIDKHPIGIPRRFSGR